MALPICGPGLDIPITTVGIQGFGTGACLLLRKFCVVAKGRRIQDGVEMAENTTSSGAASKVQAAGDMSTH